jgi:dUTP pyrophosphatase
MKCPMCGNRDKIVVDEADGFSQDTRECGECGCIWTWKDEERKIIVTGSTADGIPLRVVYLPNYVGEKLGYKHVGDSGFDLRAGIPETIVIAPDEIRIIPTGIKTACIEGSELQVRPRGGTALKGLTVINTPGTVDSNYRGEVGILVVNLSKVPFTIAPGDRIAQGVLAPVIKAKFVEVESLDDTSRGAGAYNSTGVR